MKTLKTTVHPRVSGLTGTRSIPVNRKFKKWGEYGYLEKVTIKFANHVKDKII